MRAYEYAGAEAAEREFTQSLRPSEQPDTWIGIARPGDSRQQAQQQLDMTYCTDVACIRGSEYTAASSRMRSRLVTKAVLTGYTVVQTTYKKCPMLAAIC
jgi:hypothetical protein